MTFVRGLVERPGRGVGDDFVAGSRGCGVGVLKEFWGTVVLYAMRGAERSAQWFVPDIMSQIFRSGLMASMVVGWL